MGTIKFESKFPAR